MVKIVSSDFRIRQTSDDHERVKWKEGGRKVEGKNSLPPLKTPLYKGVFRDLVEVEVNFNKKNSVNLGW